MGIGLGVGVGLGSRLGLGVRVAPVTGPLPRGGEVGVVDEGLAVRGEGHVHGEGRVPQRQRAVMARALRTCLGCGLGVG